MLIGVRKARIEDLDAMGGLLEELFSIEEDFIYDANNAARALEMMIPRSNDRAVFVADCSGVLAGMCSIQTLISTAEGQKCGIIEDVAVNKDFRRKGVGTSLISAAEKWAAQRGIKRLQLLADIDNDTAFDFYKANSWSKTKLVCLRKYVEGM